MSKALTFEVKGGFKRLAIGAMVAATFAAPAFAAWEPTKPVEFIVPAGTGGGADQMARLIQGIVIKHKLMKEPLIVLNKSGALHIDYPNGQSASFGDRSYPVRLTMRNWNLAKSVLKSGDIGFAESFIRGDWHTDNLPGLIELLSRNRAAAESLIYGTWWGNLAYRIKHLFNRNTLAGSRKNIHAHYDLGNDFYRLWLDPSMTYSSALYDKSQTATQNLEQAQDAKYRRIADELALTPGARVLEIGCGWGGFAELVATQADVQVTGLTLSAEQLAYASQRLANAGLAERVDLRLQDYRDARRH